MHAYPSREALRRFPVGQRFRKIDLVNLDIIRASPKLKLALALVCCLALLGCHSQKSAANPTIEFTKIPQPRREGEKKLTA